MTLGRKVCSFLVQKKPKKSCSGMIHNCVILSDKSDKIREILNKNLNTLSRHLLWMRPLNDFFPNFFWTFFVRVHLPTERHMSFKVKTTNFIKKNSFWKTFVSFTPQMNIFIVEKKTSHMFFKAKATYFIKKKLFFFGRASFRSPHK